jgi:capsule biosynthesis phosphatase
MIDIDGTISELKKHGQTYGDLRTNTNAVEKIRELKAAGHYIILQTARHMKTCDGDQGKVVAKIGKATLDWLQENDIPYDEIYFGKPYADVYIDDLAHQFTAWEDIETEGMDTEKVNVLIPMAGLGSRFQKAGFTAPKPLIDVLGEPMVKWAMKSFDFLPKMKKYNLIFVILDSHDKEYSLGEKLTEFFGPHTTIIKLDKITEGQSATCLAAKEYINNYNKLFIYNCDTYSTSPIWEMIEAEDPDGILSCFESDLPKYSYIKVDDYGFGVETAEKIVISNLASTGMYYFKRGRDFVSAAEKMIARKEKPGSEYYVAPLYNELLKSGKKIKPVMVTKNHILGTPEELEVFINQSSTLKR